MLSKPTTTLRSTVAVLLAVLLAACGQPPPQPAQVEEISTATERPRSTSMATSAAPPTEAPAPSAASPTEAPAPSAASPTEALAPTAAGAGTSDQAWQRLTSQTRGDGVRETIAYRQTELEPRGTFSDSYLAAQAQVAAELQIVQEDGGVALAVNLQGITANGTLLAPLVPDGEQRRPAAFLVALDPGSSVFMSLLPLDQAGEPIGQSIGINWHQHAGAYGLAATP